MVFQMASVVGSMAAEKHATPFDEHQIEHGLLQLAGSTSTPIINIAGQAIVRDKTNDYHAPLRLLQVALA